MKSEDKRILFISPTWVNIHEDIQRKLCEMGYCVTFVPEYSFPEDPFRVKGKKLNTSEDISQKIKSEYWKQKLDWNNCYFDYLLVIDGQGVNEFLIKELKTINPNIFCVNYLYDTTYSVYHFEKNFKRFNKVFTFDRGESEKYNIDLLPIYWLPADVNNDTPHYDVFGFGAYSKDRLKLYKFIHEIAVKAGKKCFLKTYHKTIKFLLLHVLKNTIRKVVGKEMEISRSEYKSGYIYHELISTYDFRNIIQCSDVIVDTKVLNQDGLTARFMWALGAEKKIITTNNAAKSYPFYSEEQILIVDEKKPLKEQENKIYQFLISDFVMTDNCRKEIAKYRLDNWIKTLLKHEICRF